MTPCIDHARSVSRAEGCSRHCSPSRMMAWRHAGTPPSRTHTVGSLITRTGHRVCTTSANRARTRIRAPPVEGAVSSASAASPWCEIAGSRSALPAHSPPRRPVVFNTTGGPCIITLKSLILRVRILVFENKDEVFKNKNDTRTIDGSPLNEHHRRRPTGRRLPWP